MDQILSMNASDIAWLRESFERCKPWIQAALDRESVCTHTVDDVWDEVESGTAQLWPTANSVCVTNIDTYPRAKILRGWIAGGDLKEILATEPVIRNWAERQGCAAVMIVGRRGWARAFPNYVETHSVVMRGL